MVNISVDPVNAYSAWPADMNLDGTVQTTETVSLNYDDARGFLNKQPDANGLGWRYWHDGFGRLSKVERCLNAACTGSPSWTVEYRYTADGRLATRDKSNDSEAAVWLLYDGGQVIAEQTTTERNTWYVWSGSTLLQSARVLTAEQGVDKLHLHQDRIGNVVLATRLNGASVQLWGRVQFDPYGRRVSGVGWEDHGVVVPYRFAGQRLDADTGQRHASQTVRS